MKLTPPKNITFWISVILAALGVLAKNGTIPGLGGVTAVWLVVIGFVVLALGVLIKGF